MINRLPVLLYTIFASLVFTVFMFLYMPLILLPPVSASGLQIGELPELKAKVFAILEERLRAENQAGIQQGAIKKDTAEAVPF